MARPNSPHRLITSAAIVVGMTLSSMPAVALAAPPTLPADQPATQPAPATADQPVAVQPGQPQPIPEPAAGTGWEDPTAAPQVQPQPQPQAQPQPMPQPTGYGPPPPQASHPVLPPQPLPPRPNPNKGLGLMIAGWSIFTVSYLSSAFGGAIAIDAGAPELGRPMLIPIAGPFIAAGQGRSATGAFGLAFVGVIQIAGVAMGTSGAIIFARSRRQARLSAAPGGLQLQF